MEGHEGFDFGDFSVDFGEFDMKKVSKFDRLQRASEGGSITSEIVFWNGLIYFTSANRNVYCAKPQDGKLVWKFETGAQIIESCPVISEGILYTGSFDHNLYAIDAKTGRLVWKFPTKDKIIAAAEVSGKAVFIGSCDQNMYAINRKSGELIWKFPTYGWVNSKPLAIGERLFFGSYDHFVYCVEKESGKLVWKFETPSEIFNTTEFGYREGVLYVPCMDGNLRVLEAGTGRLLWKRKLATYGIASSPVITQDMIIQSTRDGTLFALSFEGKVLWKYAASEEDVLGVPLVHEGRIYVGSHGDYHLYCIGMDGKFIWKFRTSYSLYQRSKILGNRIIFGSYDCTVYCLDINTRDVLWKYRTGGSPLVLPPPHESFELNVDVKKEDLEISERKKYEFGFDDSDERDTSEYKSEITYQSGTTYREKGKYQIDSDEEAL